MQKTNAVSGMRLHEAIKPRGAEKAEFQEHARFVDAVGNADYHSLQLWRRTASSKATALLGLTIEQIESICQSRDKTIARLKKRVKGFKATVARDLLEVAAEQEELDDLRAIKAKLLESLAAKEKAVGIERETSREAVSRRENVIRILAGELNVDAQLIFDKLAQPQETQNGWITLISTPMGGQPRRNRRS